MEEVFFDAVGKVTHDEIYLSRNVLVAFSSELLAGMDLGHLTDQTLNEFVRKMKRKEEVSGICSTS